MTQMISRGRVRSARVRGGRVLAEVEMADGETRTRVEVLLPMGMTAVPRAGADLLVVQVGGPDHLVALQADDANLRAAGLTPGDIGLRDERNQMVVMNGEGVTVSGALKVTIVSAGDIDVTTPGAITLNSATLTHNGTNIGADHRHGGVQSGGSLTGVPS